MSFELLPPGTEFPVEDADLYEEGCENMWDENGKPFPNGESCGGRVVSTGGHHHYSNGFDCYTMYLRCEKCGDYEVECV